MVKCLVGRVMFFMDQRVMGKLVAMGVSWALGQASEIKAHREGSLV